MYGMINNAVQDYITEEYGGSIWDNIRHAVGVQTEGFVSMESYPDNITYAIVGEACRIIGVEGAELLERIGEYWIIHTARSGYGEILDTAGLNMVDFMTNINAMHSRLSNVMPNMLVPSFDVAEAGPRSMILRYHSHRKGLEPMVKGLLQGMGKRFGQECSVEMLESLPAEGTDQKYLVTW